MNLEQLKEKILSKIEDTKGTIKIYTSETEIIKPDCNIDHALRMEAFQENVYKLEKLNQSKATLRKLTQVLTELDKPNFGQCLKCNSPIPFQRILLMPESKFCVNCAT